jgi:DDE superfamily endonuclease
MTVEGQGKTEFFATLCQLLPLFEDAFKQKRTFQRAIGLLFARLATVGRQTITQQLISLGQEQLDWSSFYRLFSHVRIREEQLFATLLKLTLEHVPCAQPYVIGVDATHIPRSSMKMPGCGWMRALATAVFMRGIQPGQRFEHCALLTPIEHGYSRAIPLRFLSAPPASAVKGGNEPRSEWEVALEEICWVRKRLDEEGRAAQMLLVLGDGTYDNVELRKQLPEQVVLLARTAKNRRLYQMPEPGCKQRGRPCIYGQKALTPQQWLQVKGGWHTSEIEVRGRTRQHEYRVQGPFVRERGAANPLFLLIVRGCALKTGKQKQRVRDIRPAFYLVSAVQRNGLWELPLPVKVLLAWVWQRWEMEVAHREMKSGLGVGEMQCWSKNGAILSVQWSVWVYALLVLVAYRCWGMTGGPTPPGKWRLQRTRRWSLNTVWRTYRSELWAKTDFWVTTRPSPDNWSKSETWIGSLLNGALKNGAT